MQTLTKPTALFLSAWNVFKANWKPLVAISVVPYAVLYVGQTFLATKNLPFVVAGVILTFAGSVVSVAMQPTIITAIQRIKREPGVKISFKEQYAVGFKYFWPVLGLSIINGIIMAGSVIWFVIPALVVGVYTCLYIFCRIVDDKKGFSSITESYSLVKGRWWGTFGRMLFLALIYIASSLVVFGFLFIVKSIFGVADKSFYDEALTGLLNVVLGAFTAPLALVYLSNLFESLKSTRIAGVQTDGYRKWIMFFMVVGIIVIFLTPIIALGIAATTSSSIPAVIQP